MQLLDSNIEVLRRRVAAEMLDCAARHADALAWAGREAGNAEICRAKLVLVESSAFAKFAPLLQAVLVAYTGFSDELRAAVRKWIDSLPERDGLSLNELLALPRRDELRDLPADVVAIAMKWKDVPENFRRLLETVLAERGTK